MNMHSIVLYLIPPSYLSENEKMCVAGEPRRSEDAIQDIFHKVAQLKKADARSSGSPTV